MSKRKSQKDRYVTKVEFDEAMGIVKKSFDHVATKDQLQAVADDVGVLKDDVGTLKTKVNTLEENQKTILEIVKSIDENTKDMKGIPERVDKLEEDVFRLKLKQNLK